MNILEGDPDKDVIAKAYLKEVPRYATYESAPLRPDGIRLSEKVQRYSMDLLQEVFRGRFHSQLKAKLTPADEKAFMDAFMEEKGNSLGAETYGELCPAGVLEMLWTVGAKAGDRFYDLGAGPGKVVALAWLAGMRATGIELSESRWLQSCYAMKALKTIDEKHGTLQDSELLSENLPLRAVDGMDHLWGSFFDLDFLDADVLFVSSVMFSSQMMGSLALLARWMKPGTKIITYHPFFGDEFKELGVILLPTSWCGECRWYVQELVQHPPATEKNLPEGLRRADQFDPSQRCAFEERGVEPK